MVSRNLPKRNLNFEDIAKAILKIFGRNLPKRNLNLATLVEEGKVLKVAIYQRGI